VERKDNTYDVSHPKGPVKAEQKVVLGLSVDGHKMPWDAIDAVAHTSTRGFPIVNRVGEEPVVVPVVLSCRQWFEKT
jgi:hypothetical protein